MEREKRIISILNNIDIYYSKLNLSCGDLMWKKAEIKPFLHKQQINCRYSCLKAHISMCQDVCDLYCMPPPRIHAGEPYIWDINFPVVCYENCSSGVVNHASLLGIFLRHLWSVTHQIFAFSSCSIRSIFSPCSLPPPLCLCVHSQLLASRTSLGTVQVSVSNSHWLMGIPLKGTVMWVICAVIKQQVFASELISLVKSISRHLVMEAWHSVLLSHTTVNGQGFPMTGRTSAGKYSSQTTSDVQHYGYLPCAILDVEIIRIGVWV